MLNNEALTLCPAAFFSLQFDCKRCPEGDHFALTKKHVVPDASSLNGDTVFAEMRMGWDPEGLAILLKVNKKAERSLYPRIDTGDALELFIDTRDVKTSGYNTKFCHHFFFMPQSFEGHQAGELTHFRTEDKHPLCSSADLQLDVETKKNHYTLKIFIPSHCLVGYDTDLFERLGFTYRIHRAGGPPQHFSVHSNDFRIEEQPSTWATARMIG